MCKYIHVYIYIYIYIHSTTIIAIVILPCSFKATLWQCRHLPPRLEGGGRGGLGSHRGYLGPGGEQVHEETLHWVHHGEAHGGDRCHGGWLVKVVGEVKDGEGW